MSVAPARRAAYHVLLDVERETADLPRGIAKARGHLPDPRDQALMAEIAIGTLRWRAALDHVIGHFARRSLDHFDPEVLTVLRLTLYQLGHLTRIPASAAVNEAVDLVRGARKKSAAGLVNAVLRRAAATREAWPLPRRPEREAPEYHERLLDYFSITLSHPRWLAARWLARYGDAATEAWLRFDNAEAPLTLRANGLKTSAGDLARDLERHGVSTAPARYAPDGLVVTAGNPIRTPLDKEGAFMLQDEASQLVGLALPVQEGGRVLDACASPGNKTTEIAAQIHDRGMIVACDVRAGRIALLEETIRKAGATCVRLAQVDFTRPAPFRPVFDAVLLDAPCSGLGTVRRDPDIKWRRRPEDLPVLAGAQLAMLRHASAVVRAGGFLLYSTCSSEPEENEEVAAAFLAGNDAFRAAPPEMMRARGLGSVIDEAAHLRTSPHAHGLEAFFAALFVRTTP